MTAETFNSLVQAFGWPGAILMLLFGGMWRVWSFAKPWLIKVAEAYIFRQKEVAQSQKDLASQIVQQGKKSLELSERSIQIQESVAKSVETIPDAIERLFRAHPSKK